MPKVKQPNSSKVQSLLHEYASEFTSTPKGELFRKFCDCLVKSDKRFVVEAHRRSAKHQRGLFHETKSSQTFLERAIPDFADKLRFVSFNTPYEYALYYAFQLKTQKMDRSKFVNYKVKILSF